MYIRKAYRTKPVPSTGMGAGSATVNNNHHRNIYISWHIPYTNNHIPYTNNSPG
jgi:hypothetical protein